jgi:pectinesterase
MRAALAAEIFSHYAVRESIDVPKFPPGCCNGRGDSEAMPMKFVAAFAFAAALSAQTSQPAIKILLVGDSTVTDASGWGAGFAKMLKPAAECVNLSAGGRSSKSFIAEGRWEKALTVKADYVLIQFGHNDEPGKGPERETDPGTTYRANMARYVDEARAAGAKPILVTSLTRRSFGPNGKIKSTLGPYVEAVRKLAAEKSVPLIDLYALSLAEVERMGPAAAVALDPAPGTDGKPDKTHLNSKGSDFFGAMIAHELVRVVPDLAPYLDLRDLTASPAL